MCSELDDRPTEVSVVIAHPGASDDYPGDFDLAGQAQREGPTWWIGDRAIACVT